MESVVVAQICFIALMFLVTLGFVLLPLAFIPRDQTLTSSPTSARILTLCNCFSAGVFLAVCNLQLTGFVNYQFALVFGKLKVDPKYSLTATQWTVFIGFILVLFVDQIVKIVQRREKEKKALFHGVVHLQGLTPGTSATGSETSSPGDSGEEGFGIKDGERRRMLGMESARSAMGSNATASHDHSGHSHLSFIKTDKLDLRSFLLLAALSLHSFFEGLALGLQDELSKLVNLFVGVLLHEVLVAFAVGVNLAQQRITVANIVKLSLFFSLVIPLGMVVGLAVEMTDDSISGLMASAIIQGLAAGTFVYVAFLDILPTEFNKENDELLKTFFVIVGFAVVGGISFGIGRDSA